MTATPAWKTVTATEPQLALVPLLRMPHTSRATLAVVALAHAGLLTALLNAPETPKPINSINPPRPLMVSLIEPEVPQVKPEPKAQPPKPAIKPLPPPPALAAQRPVPTPDLQQAAEAPKPLPAPVTNVLPPPVTVVMDAPKPAPSLPPHPANYLANPKPPYPLLSRRLGEAGTVRLNILVNPDGSVDRLELAQSSGYPRLDRAALETVQSSWKFEPARQGGRPVAAWVIVPIQFTLRS
ncbi:energy transducer TonB [Thiobacillus sp. 65-1402]|uniref:energy transducer TonB n=1 Tax=Thiobacillus sp. 65-1402 TaxID=1895861 RepID=UPI000AF33F71|nr:energy transducer TonB [Thiobacillus sp. 65-1402]